MTNSDLQVSNLTPSGTSMSSKTPGRDLKDMESLDKFKMFDLNEAFREAS